MKIKILSITTLSLCALMQFSYASDEVAREPLKQNAQHLIPHRGSAYTFEEIIPIFEPHLDESVKQDYQQFFKALFNKLPEQVSGKLPHFPAPLHPNRTIITGWQCLLDKVMNATRDPETQKNALLDLAALHVKPLEKILPELAASAKDHAPCSKCKDSIKHQYLPGEGEQQ